ncbi:MAG: SDR family NAD(P)-dependent oxidoreductase [Bacteroidia bacterium]
MNNYLIVGASSGIGLNTLQKLTLQNHKVFSLSRTGDEIKTLPNVVWQSLDISLDNPEFPVIEEPLHGIVYCPGTINLKPFKAFKAEDFLQDYKINLLGAVKTIKQYLPNLQHSENSSIVLFSTVAVQTGMAFHASIASAKGAVEGLTKSLAAEFAPKIRVNAIAPSLTHTPLADKLLNTEQKIQAAAERHPLKKVGSTNDITDAVLYLLNAQWVTGQILHVDGGMSTLK